MLPNFSSLVRSPSTGHGVSIFSTAHERQFHLSVFFFVLLRYFIFLFGASACGFSFPIGHHSYHRSTGGGCSSAFCIESLSRHQRVCNVSLVCFSLLCTCTPSITHHGEVPSGELACLERSETAASSSGTRARMSVSRSPDYTDTLTLVLSP